MVWKKKKEILHYITTWMIPAEDTVLHGIRQVTDTNIKQSLFYQKLIRSSRKLKCGTGVGRGGLAAEETGSY